MGKGRRFVRVDLVEAARRGVNVPPALLMSADKIEMRVQVVDDPIPAALAFVATALKWLGAQAAEAIIGDVIGTVTAPVTSFVETKFKTFVLDQRRSELLDVLRSSFYSQLYASSKTGPDGVSYDDTALDDAVYNTMKATIYLSAVVSDDAGEIAMESLQEAFSNAVYAGIAGQLTATAKYRAGFEPLDDIPGYTQPLNIHYDTRAIMDAFGGKFIHHTIANEADRRINAAIDAYRRFDLLDDVSKSLEASRTIHAQWLAEAAPLIRDAIHKVVDDVRAILYTLLRRVSDILAEVRVARADYDAGLISPEEYNIVIYDAYLELQEIDKEIDDVLSDLEQAVSSVPTKLDIVESKLTLIQDQLVKIYGDYVDQTIFIDFPDYIYTLLNIRKYAKLSNVKWSIYNGITDNEHFYSIMG